MSFSDTYLVGSGRWAQEEVLFDVKENIPNKVLIRVFDGSLMFGRFV